MSDLKMLEDEILNNVILDADRLQFFNDNIDVIRIVFHDEFMLVEKLNSSVYQTQKMIDDNDKYLDGYMRYSEYKRESGKILRQITKVLKLINK